MISRIFNKLGYHLRRKSYYGSIDNLEENIGYIIKICEGILIKESFSGTKFELRIDSENCTGYNDRSRRMVKYKIINTETRDVVLTTRQMSEVLTYLEGLKQGK